MDYSRFAVIPDFTVLYDPDRAAVTNRYSVTLGFLDNNPFHIYRSAFKKYPMMGIRLTQVAQYLVVWGFSWVL